MTPRALVIAIASVFFVCVATYLAIKIESAGSLRSSHIIRFALATALAVSLVRGGVFERWATIVIGVCGAVVAINGAIYLNSVGRPAIGMVILGVGFSLCAVGLLVPYVGRHFSRKLPAEQGGADQPTAAADLKSE